MDTKKLAIGALTVSAVILGVALLVVNLAPPAMASEVSSYGGDFTVTVGRVTRDTELLYVIDNITQRLIVYGFDRRSGVAAIVDQKELAIAQMATP